MKLCTDPGEGVSITDCLVDKGVYEIFRIMSPGEPEESPGSRRPPGPLACSLAPRPFPWCGRCSRGSQRPTEKAFTSFPGLPRRTPVFNQRQGISATMCWNNCGFLTNQMGMTTRYEVGLRRVQWIVSLINSDR